MAKKNKQVQPWLASWILDVSRNYGSNFTAATRQEATATIVKVVQAPTIETDAFFTGYLWDNSYTIHFRIQPSVVRNYRQRNPHQDPNVSTAIIHLKEIKLRVQKIPQVGQDYATLKEQLVLECRSFDLVEVLSDQEWSMQRIKAANIGKKHPEISQYLEGLQTGGGGGNVHIRRTEPTADERTYNHVAPTVFPSQDSARSDYTYSPKPKKPDMPKMRTPRVNDRSTMRKRHSELLAAAFHDSSGMAIVLFQQINVNIRLDSEQPDQPFASSSKIAEPRPKPNSVSNSSPEVPIPWSPSPPRAAVPPIPSRSPSPTANKQQPKRRRVLEHDVDANSEHEVEMALSPVRRERSVLDASSPFRSYLPSSPGTPRRPASPAVKVEEDSSQVSLNGFQPRHDVSRRVPERNPEPIPHPSQRRELVPASESTQSQNNKQTPHKALQSGVLTKSSPSKEGDVSSRGVDGGERASSRSSVSDDSSSESESDSAEEGSDSNALANMSLFSGDEDGDGDDEDGADNNDNDDNGDDEKNDEDDDDDGELMTQAVETGPLQQAETHTPSQGLAPVEAASIAGSPQRSTRFVTTSRDRRQAPRQLAVKTVSGQAPRQLAVKTASGPSRVVRGPAAARKTACPPSSSSEKDEDMEEQFEEADSLAVNVGTQQAVTERRQDVMDASDEEEHEGEGEEGGGEGEEDKDKEEKDVNSRDAYEDEHQPIAQGHGKRNESNYADQDMGPEDLAPHAHSEAAGPDRPEDLEMADSTRERPRDLSDDDQKIEDNLFGADSPRGMRAEVHENEQNAWRERPVDGSVLKHKQSDYRMDEKEMLVRQPGGQRQSAGGPSRVFLGRQPRIRVNTIMPLESPPCFKSFYMLAMSMQQPERSDL
ncbi:hypothetical protein CYLTODRAFT_448068 [Cylindrobasidium torrendii FP15055 ss-10]|uniref:Uncharacterized protein n=1 Tax=Cylindrobasidium torrendii FP15055 ss-10 TaxID=1314674 RepID=A0A0D7BXE2_9AGAR|nr:hypothetical protein CYLTODRAFT_448068 [Cylindrobasidium torrendii FP15055 ss-10]